MKKQCVVITAYKEPSSLRGLLQVLHKKFFCFVHIDKKSKDKFSGIETEFPDVVIISKYSINWGGMEHLQSVIELLSMTMKIEFSYVHIISGEDFPVKSLDEIEDFFENDNRIWCECKTTEKGQSRRYRWFNYYWPYVRLKLNYKDKWIRYASLMVVGLQALFPFTKKNKIGEFDKVYGGLIWASYPREAVEYLLKYLDANPKFWNDLNWCKIPEELAFPTILKNSYLAERITGDNKRYGNMERGDGWGPVYLNESDLEDIDESGAFFARKIKADGELKKILLKRQEVNSSSSSIH